MKKILFGLFIFSFTNITANAQTRIALDCNQPIDDVSGDIQANATAAVVATTCTPWVRLNFILGPWSSPSDLTLHSGKTWKQTYDEIVDDFIVQGIEVYALIGSQATDYPGDLMIDYPGIDSAGAEAWIQQYVSNFVQIVDYFKDRVRVYESYNEPNNWDNGWTSVLHPKWFAKILQEVYLNTKYFNAHWGDPAWQVTLVSGPVLTHDLDNGGSYINDTYWYGINEFAWDWTNTQTGSYPLDGFGMHIYVAQGSTDANTIINATNQNLNDFWNNITFYEGATPKQIWISEYGWESNAVGYQGQADNLTTGFNLLKSDSRIALATWFSLTDWPGASYGLYEIGNFAPADQKISFSAFKNQVSCYATNFQVTQTGCSTFSFSWTNTGNGWWLDVSPDSNFSFYYNKNISNQTSIDAPSGFLCDSLFSPCTPSSLSFQPGTTYYWRIWNGAVHSYGQSFTAPGAPPAPTAGTNATYCLGDTIAALTATGTNIEWFSDAGLTTLIGTGSPFAITPGTGTTTYYVTQTVSGCVSPSASVVITVNPNPPTPTISESGGILMSSSATSYQWFFNGDTIAGATSLFYTPAQNGFYTVTVTDVNGCSSASAAFPFNPIGIEESASADMLNIYPNPTTGKVAVAGGSSISSIEIYNAMGEKVTGYWSLVTGKQPAASSRQPVTIDLSGKAKGLYFIYIMTNDRMFVRKVSLVK